MTPSTLFDKIWAAHEVAPGLIYIDLHLVHEVTSPQAFDGLRLAGRPVRRPDRTLATADHNVPTDGTPVAARIRDELSRVQVETLERNCDEFGDPGLLDRLRPPGDRARHRAGARGHPAGHDDRLRRLPHRHPRRLRRARVRHRHQRGRARARHPVPRAAQAEVDAHQLRRASSASASRAKDLILGTIGQMGTDGAAGHVVEYAGPVIEGLSMEGRMTICNMTIEGGGRAGMIAPDDTTFEWVERPPRGARASFDAAVDVARAAHRRRRDASTRDRGRRRRALAAGHLGHDARAWSSPRHRARPRAARRQRRARAEVHGRSSPARRCRRSGSTACSSARARTPASATCGPRPMSSRAAGRTTSTRWSSPAPSRCAAQAEAEGLDERLPRRRLRLAHARAARCAWA